MWGASSAGSATSPSTIWRNSRRRWPQPSPNCSRSPRRQPKPRKGAHVGLKVDSSFLKFVTMGALGARRVSELMARAGLQPIELERYSRSNKIWSTKVKRLRLPDLLCVRTGLRVEVRAKSKLSIKMSDTPTAPDRRWNTGLASGDMIAFVLIREAEEGTFRAAPNAELFWVESLETREAESRLGPPKSATEVVELTVNGPQSSPSTGSSTIPAGSPSGRNQTYQLKGKRAYFAAEEPFLAESQFLAGLPAGKAAFPNPQQVRWNPRDMLRSDSAIDRYVAVKALGVVGKASDVPTINNLAEHDPEGRVALEAAAALVRLGNDHGLELLRDAIENPTIDYLRMEAVLALSEFHGSGPRYALCRPARRVHPRCSPCRRRGPPGGNMGPRQGRFARLQPAVGVSRTSRPRELGAYCVRVWSRRGLFRSRQLGCRPT